MTHWHRVAALAAAVALLAGCSETTPGTASGGPTASSGATSQPPSTRAKPSVTRPKKIDLTGVDPCSLLTAAQKQQFDLTKEPGRLPYPTHPESVLCGIRSSDFSYGVGLTVLTVEGIEMYDPAIESGKASPAEVGGFPAVVNQFPGALQACFVGVDIADGQLIDVQVDGAEIRMDELCARATGIAEAAVQTISAK